MTNLCESEEKICERTFNLNREKLFKKTTLDNLPSTPNKNLHSKSTYFLKLTHQESWRSNGFLKGQSQLIHMRIRYHFLADLHVTGHARET